MTPYQAKIAMKLLGMSQIELRQRIGELTERTIGQSTAANWFYRASDKGKKVTGKKSGGVPDFLAIFLLLTLEAEGLTDEYREQVGHGL